MISIEFLRFLSKLCFLFLFLQEAIHLMIFFVISTLVLIFRILSNFLVSLNVILQDLKVLSFWKVVNNLFTVLMFMRLMSYGLLILSVFYPMQKFNSFVLFWGMKRNTKKLLHDLSAQKIDYSTFRDYLISSWRQF